MITEKPNDNKSGAVVDNGVYDDPPMNHSSAADCGDPVVVGRSGHS